MAHFRAGKLPSHHPSPTPASTAPHPTPPPPGAAQHRLSGGHIASLSSSAATLAQGLGPRLYHEGPAAEFKP